MNSGTAKVRNCGPKCQNGPEKVRVLALVPTFLVGLCDIRILMKWSGKGPDFAKSLQFCPYRLLDVQCAFLNVSSNCLHCWMHTHIGCNCLVFVLPSQMCPQMLHMIIIASFMQSPTSYFITSVKLFSSWPFSRWIFRSSYWVNDLLLSSHLWSFSPVAQKWASFLKFGGPFLSWSGWWMRKWMFRAPDWLNGFLHSAHFVGFLHCEW